MDADVRSPDLTGRINGWVCRECKRATLAVHVDHGVTPFMLGCRATPICKGIAESMFYPESTPHMDVINGVAWEWYRMSDKQAKKAERRAPGTLDHHNNGGLDIRPLTARGLAILRERYGRDS